MVRNYKIKNYRLKQHISDISEINKEKEVESLKTIIYARSDEDPI